MSERSYQYLIGGLCLAVLLSMFWTSKSRNEYKVNIQTVAAAADGLDLRAVGALVKEARIPS